MLQGSISPMNADLWEIQFFPAANSVSHPSPNPYECAGLNQYLPQSKFCVLSIYYEFLLYARHCVRGQGFKKKKKSSKATSCLLFDRKHSMLVIISEPQTQPSLPCFVELELGAVIVLLCQQLCQQRVLEGNCKVISSRKALLLFSVLSFLHSVQEGLMKLM